MANVKCQIHSYIEIASQPRHVTDRAVSVRDTSRLHANNAASIFMHGEMEKDEINFIKSIREGRARF